MTPERRRELISAFARCTRYTGKFRFVCVCAMCVCWGRGGGLHAPGGGIAEPDVAALGLSHGGVTGVTGTAWWCCRTKT